MNGPNTIYDNSLSLKPKNPPNPHCIPGFKLSLPPNPTKSLGRRKFQQIAKWVP